MSRPTMEDFNELGKDLDKSLDSGKLLNQLYNELGALQSRTGYFGKKRLVQLYFPDRDEIFLGTVKMKKKIDKRTEQLDPNMIIQNYIHKRDTRTPPVFFSTEEYDVAERTEKLEYRIEMFHVLNREPMLMYFVHRTEEVE